ncbi:amino acid adenylation domain-containing protein [Pseudonocardiaceae bacterium YIM PH 21723]|nr:amino acid adenylation domain-containing protein [Pseudonocardiaceae bacterium YIM PH 21723]
MLVGMSRRPFSSFVLGESPLLVECAKVLIERGHLIRGIASADPQVRRWADERSIPVISTGESPAELVEFAAGNRFDYLFSIANTRFLPAEMLELPEEMAIGFHDGRFAGPWAIWNGATTHGVSWRTRTDVLKAADFSLDTRETGHSLAMRCADAGLSTFAELVDELADRRATPAPHDLQDRADRPSGGLTLSPAQPAQELDDAIRACHFGPLANEFGTAKLWTGADLLHIRAGEPLDRISVEPPGTVVAVTEDEVTMSSGTKDIRLRLATLDGDPLTAGRLADDWGIRPGFRFPVPSTELLDDLAAAYREGLAAEADWVRRLSALRPAQLPYRRIEAADSEPGDLPVPLPDWISGPADVLAALAGFLQRITGEPEFDLGLCVPPRSPLFAALTPIRITEATTFTELRDRVTAGLGRVQEHRSCLRDLGTRHRLPAAPRFPVQVELDETVDAGEADLLVRITRDECRFLVHPAIPDAEALTGAFAAYLAGLGDEDLHRAELVTPAGRRQLLTEWNHTAAHYPRHATVSRLFADHARQRPTAPAITFGGATMSYGELDQRSSALARHLAEQGVGAGSLVGVHLPRTPDLVVALLAVLKSGAAYVPLDPGQPAERTATVLADARTLLVITEDFLAGADLTGEADPIDRASGKDLAYVIYTSGSTGTPKGVRIGHRSLINVLTALQRSPGFSVTDTLLAVSTVSFDIAAVELFLPLISGGTVALARAEVAADPVALRHELERIRPRIMQATPATWRMLVDAGWQGGAGLTALTGGDTLDQPLADTLALRTAQLWNLYGPTETTIWSTMARIDGPVSIGRPLPNTSCFVLDDRQRLLPPGIPGELCIAGDGVADGYLRRPELTRERFIPNPFGSGDRLYRTGDRARWTLDGRLELLGRLDQQIKLNGHRIEPGEIESVLLRRPEVAQAVVIARTGRLLGYVVAEPGMTVDPGALRTSLAGLLPGYLVPAIIAVQRLPLTPNGKLDRDALPEPPTGPAKPGTDAERLLCDLFARVLNVRAVGPHDGFADLGGNSVLAIRLAGMAASAGLPLDPAQVQDGTPAALAAALDRPVPPAEPGLASDIQPAASMVQISDRPGEVLLTGAGGFLGAYLLRELAGTRVHCVMSGPDGLERLRENLIRFRLPVELLSGVRVLSADPGAPDLGLSTARFAELSRSVDAIYHAGNPDPASTESLLRLAAEQHTVPVHVVLDGPAELVEQNLRLARERGLPAAVYRLPMLSGDAVTGAVPLTDPLWVFLRGCVIAGAVPDDVDLSLDLLPVDYAAAAIRWLSRHATADVHRLGGSRPVPLSMIVRHLNLAGYPLRAVPRDTWAAQLAAGDQDLAAVAVSRLTPVTESPGVLPLLEPSGIECPEIDQRYLDRVIHFLIRAEFLPLPPGAALPRQRLAADHRSVSS